MIVMSLVIRQRQFGKYDRRRDDVGDDNYNKMTARITIFAAKKFRKFCTQ